MLGEVVAELQVAEVAEAVETLTGCA